MDKEEVCKLFDLLEELYQGKRKARNERTLSIWSTVLGPWGYEQVRDVTVKRARTNRYFPDPSELAAMLPQTKLPTGEDCKYSEVTVGYVAFMRQQAEERSRLYQEAGVPTFLEARAQGLSYAQWSCMCREAGI